MPLLSLELLRQTVSLHITGFTNHTVKSGIKPVRVRRLKLEYGAGGDGPPSVIVKETAPRWPDDPPGVDRERLFYERLHPCLSYNKVRVYYAGIDPDTAHRLIVMEDLSGGYRFPPPEHRWTAGELHSVVRAYAALHVQGQRCLPPADRRGWMFSVQEIRWRPEQLLEMTGELVRRGLLCPLPRLERLITCTLEGARRFAGYPVTLIHNDVYPPNHGLPLDPDQGVMLIDWEMAGWGMAELDLAYMFVLPFQNTRIVPRADVLEDYWEQRRRLEGEVPPARERAAAQRHADRLWALYLIPVAHRVARRPFPPGSGPAAYWHEMFGVLDGRLHALCR